MSQLACLYSHIYTPSQLAIHNTHFPIDGEKISKYFFQLTGGNSRSRNSSSTLAKTGDISQPGSVPDWWVCIQTNVPIGRCLQMHTHTDTLQFLFSRSIFYVTAKATYIRLLHGKIGFLGFFSALAP